MKILDQIHSNEFDYQILDNRFIGIPAAAAFRLGMDLYNGDGLALDHKKAFGFLAYAALCGDPRARVALSLFDHELLNERMLLSKYFDTHLDALALSLMMRTGQVEIFGFNYEHCSLDLSTQGQLQKGLANSFEQTLYFNIMSFAQMMIANGHEDFFEQLETNYPFINKIVYFFAAFMDVKNLEPRTYAAMALHMEMTKEIDLMISLKENNLIAVNVYDNDKIARLLFKHIEKSKDIFALRAYFNADDFNVESRFGSKVIRLLAKAGDGRANFILGARYMQDEMSTANEAKAMEYWQKAADYGYGYGYFNVSLAQLLKNKLDEALDNASMAVNGGVTYGYYVLYQVYKSSQPQLACTYLRYAAQYLFPLAIKELTKLKVQNKYRPLPYMQAIEKLEALAKKSSTAAVYMMSLYMDSGIMPDDMLQGVNWVRQAICLGDNQIIKELSSFYHHATTMKFSFNCLSSINQALQHNRHHQMKALLENKDQYAKQADDLVKELYFALKDGKSDLEAKIYTDSVNNHYWQAYKFFNDDLASHNGHLSEHEQVKLQRYISYLLRFKLSDEMFSDKSYLDLRYKMLEKIYLLPSIKSGEQRMSKVLTCLRGVFTAFDLNLFYEYAQYGANQNNLLCQLLLAQDLCFLNSSNADHTATAPTQPQRDFLSTEILQ